MLERSTLDTFAPLLGERFRLPVEGREPLDMMLASVTEIPVSGWRPGDVAEHRTPFSLVFNGSPHFVLPQAIYSFEHVGIGVFEFFIRTARGRG